MDKLVNILAYRNGDTSFQEFSSQDYSTALFFAKRKVSKKYQISQRLYSFIIKNASDADITLPIESFISELKVTVNNINFEKVKDVKDEPKKNIYKIERTYNSLVFNCSPKTLGDEISIYYNSDITDDLFILEELEPIIPTQYNEELISFSMQEISKVGLTKYSAVEYKVEKFKNILRLYPTDENVPDSTTSRNDAPIIVKLYNVL